MQKIFNMTFPFLLLLSMLVSVTTSQHHHEEVKEAAKEPGKWMGPPPGTTPWCAKVLNCRFGLVAQRAARMKDSVIEALKRQMEALKRQMEAQSQQIVALQTKYRLRDEELNKKIDRIAAAIKTN